MTREQRIVEMFVELADTMVDDFDVVDFLHDLTGRAVDLLDCAEAGVLIVDASGVLRVMASSSERSATLELLQSQHLEGPCYEASARGEAVFSEDLGGELMRWPQFAPAAVEQGFRSVQALPMRARGQTIGALNLFRAAPGRIGEADVPLAQGMADMAALALLQERSLREAQIVVTQLQAALRSRVVIEQAKGLLSERARVSTDQAFILLRDHSRDRRRRLSDVAHDVLAGRVTLGQLGAAEPLD